ncbi:MAG: hypothetical protein ACOCTT_03365, partial [archaeon]
EEKSQEILTELEFLKNTREITKDLKEDVDDLLSLHNRGVYEEFIEKAPELINKLKRKPLKGTEIVDNGEEELENETEDINNSKQTGDQEKENQELEEFKKEVNKICSITDCGELEKNLEKHEKHEIKDLKGKIEELEERVNSKLAGNSEEIENTFKSLEKAFKETVEFQVNKENIPYTPEDFESLKNRRDKIETKESSLVTRNLDYLLDSKKPSEVKELIEKEETLIDDSKDLLSQMEKSSIDRMQKAKDKYGESDTSLHYLEKAKNHHSEGEYLNSMLSSKKSVEETSEKGFNVPYKHLAGAFLILGTTLYVLKKPKDEKIDKGENNPIKLKRGK